MLIKFFQSHNPDSRMRAYHQSTPTDYLDQMTPEIRASLNPGQLSEITWLLDKAIPKPAPKIVDLRFSINLILTRFFIVLMVGQDRRRQPRPRTVSMLTRVGNWVAAVVLLLSLNLMLSLALFLAIYLVKSALGINLLPGHFWSNVKTS